jgi:exopolysaccharide biosynthesis polyprenyl glycosylphosphotransferase
MTTSAIRQDASSARPGWRQRLFRSAFPFVAIDVLAVVVAYFATWGIRFHSDWGNSLFAMINAILGVHGVAEVVRSYESFYLFNAPRIICLLMVTLVFLYGFLGLYEGRRFVRRRYVSAHLIVANLIALAIFYGYFYLTRNQFHPRSVFVTLLILNAVFAISLRRLMASLWNRTALVRCPAVLFGAAPETEFLDRFFAARRPHHIEIVARIPFDPGQRFEHCLERVGEAVRRHGTRMIICADKRLTVAQIMRLLEMSDGLRQEVKVLSDKLGVLVNEAGMPSDFFFETPFVHFAVPSLNGLSVRARCVLSRLASATGFILVAPLFLLIAVLVKLTSPGPIFFVQERMGVNRKPFLMYKFRTMYDRAEELQAQVEEFNESGEGLFKIKRDPRVTPVGRFLRRFSLDELPQLINVVRGEMTLVGPRPLPRRDYENYYEEWHYTRHSGLPGLTCLWQVSGRSDISFHNMCILDDYYLRNQNAMLDLKILLRTCGVVLFARGAY